ncbi:hypothetical protein DCO58_10965 [Helicobacter saguini]|uniref:Outer membrane protein n=1 Tax=Helicobacter saguini TaxID=1548018 RepID=A0A347VPW4_9HELI|nr:hypothetical protein [Helicobacter saguini]MWV61185.1 hypothetical protein [Helicobacter saguini]MWV68148.1 hypothetical protein [Helicobacter saguini]MWV70389.1 hypothetical protein [Helicobacter saguini]MWV72290.1 hypothetical protein [Helicobacter saguini]TLD95329.1 hypothetical protein LS64_003010 [Helicobacter saguini]
MRYFSRCFFLFLCLLNLAFARYTNLDAALLNGSKKVDILLFGDYMASQNGVYTNNLFGDSKRVGNLGYINAQVGLGYTTGFYYNLRFAISFRAAQALLNLRQDMRKDFTPNTANSVFGDSSVALGETFLEYFDGDTAIKLGRFQPISEWISHLVDGILVQNGSFKNLVIEGLWAYDYGRVSYYEISAFRALGNVGYFNFGARYYLFGNQRNLKDSTYINAFSTFVPGVFVTIGGRAHWAKVFSNNFWLGVNAGFTGSIEDHSHIRSFNNNTFLIDAKILAGIKNIDFMVGYVGSGAAGMGSIGVLGAGSGTQIDMNSAFYKNVQPFFVWGGRAIKMGSSAHLLYAAGRFSFFDSKFNAYLAYGVTFFNGSRYYGGLRANGTPIQGLVQNEINAMLEFKITNTLSAISHITTTFNKGVSNSFELNAGVRFMF